MTSSKNAFKGAVIEEAAVFPSDNPRKSRKGDSSSKRSPDLSPRANPSRKLRNLATVGSIGMHMKPLSTGLSEHDQNAKAATGPENSENEEAKGVGALSVNQDNNMTQIES